MNGFLNILKPPAMTSSDVVMRARKAFYGDKAGHAGTLDPEAAGVLPVMIGGATRLFDYLTDKRKTYVAVVTFGESTDTQDAQGAVIERGENYPSLHAVEKALSDYCGKRSQTPSAFSAVKVGGKRLYQLARSGENVFVPSREVEIYSAGEVSQLSEVSFRFSVSCGKGTYIRTICDDLGKALGCPAHMSYLIRTQSGAFTSETAVTLEELSEKAERGEQGSLLLPPDMPFSALGRIDIPETNIFAVANGCPLPNNAGGEDGELRRAYARGIFAGLMRLSSSGWRFAALIDQTGLR
ncbi:MAG: tRNA pseudouridine(55) synthase TruB [Eubacteriales bacterium]|nr:tRNA pseudouridine(55) synthase TruB [Eubacteriales bacterium]MDD3882305.1 tRNA pseudouridine(55) synthase TruB [Eubacteriales bacterium]MDD4512051.1 tRNA pseudouridine(55) synthase TruB [Eubacteriales bacterium]